MHLLHLNVLFSFKGPLAHPRTTRKCVDWIKLLVSIDIIYICVMGRMTLCLLRKDKIKSIKILNEWLKDAESKMQVLNITDQQQKKNFVRSGAGHKLINFREKEAGVKYDGIEADPDNGRKAVDADKY